MTRPPKRKSKRPAPGTQPQHKAALAAPAKSVEDPPAKAPLSPPKETVRYSAPETTAAPQAAAGHGTVAKAMAPTASAKTNGLAPALPDEARLPAGRHSLEAIRLASALSQVQNLTTDRREFRSAAEEAPFLLRTLGLGAGLATLAAKEGGRQEFAKLLAAWLLRDCPHSPLTTNNPPTVASALSATTGSDRATYRAAQIEAMGYATSLKRMAQALCPKESG